MKRHLLALIALGLPLAALAAGPQQAPAPPPPEMDAPAAKAAPADKPAGVRDAPATTDANGEPAPIVSVRKQGNDTVEEYRRDGRLTMIRITPKGGVAQTYIANADGKLVRDARQGPVDPVYFTVYQWK